MDLRGIRIGSVLGIPLRLDLSVIIIFAIIATSLATAALPELAEGYRPVEYWAVGIGAALLFFASLLAHELSHSVVARRKQVPVRDITLWLFGGVSTIEGEAHSPRDEFEIAVAGPAMSFGLAFAGIAAAGVASAVGASDLVISAFAWLASINVLLGIFNLVPAAPLDGGRVLHALLWKRHGDRTRAQVTAARAGRGFAWFLVAGGIAEIWLLGSVGGVWLILMGWFLFTAARAEETQAIVTRDLAGVTVRAVMTPHPITAPADATVESLLHDYVLQHRCSAFPVVDANGELTGLVTLNRLRQVAAANRATTKVRDVAWPLAAVTCVHSDEQLLDVLRTADDTGDGRILVIDNGLLAGIVSPTDVSRAIQAAELQRAA
jgi:Zn-dependent protease/predicted transcriptional regulator